MRILAFVLAGAVASTGAAAVSELRAARAHLAPTPVAAAPDERSADRVGDRLPDRAPEQPLPLTPSSRGGGALPFGGVPSQPVEEETVTREAPHPVVLDVEDRCPDPESYDGPTDVDDDGCPEPLPANGPIAVSGKVLTETSLPRRALRQQLEIIVE